MLFNIFLGLVGLYVVGDLVPIAEAVPGLEEVLLFEPFEQINLLECSPVFLEDSELQLIDDVVEGRPLLQPGKARDAMDVGLHQDESERTRVLLADDAVVFLPRLHDTLRCCFYYFVVCLQFRLVFTALVHGQMLGLPTLNDYVFDANQIASFHIYNMHSHYIIIQLTSCFAISCLSHSPPPHQ